MYHYQNNVDCKSGWIKWTPDPLNSSSDQHCVKRKSNTYHPIINYMAQFGVILSRKKKQGNFDAIGRIEVYVYYSILNGRRVLSPICRLHLRSFGRIYDFSSFLRFYSIYLNWSQVSNFWPWQIVENVWYECILNLNSTETHNFKFCSSC